MIWLLYANAELSDVLLIVQVLEGVRRFLQCESLLVDDGLEFMSFDGLDEFLKVYTRSNENTADDASMLQNVQEGRLVAVVLSPDCKI